MKTSEEFFREKIREAQGIVGSMDALWKYHITGEDALRWANEFGKEAYNQAIDDAAENAEVRFIPFSDNMEVNLESILKLKK